MTRATCHQKAILCLLLFLTQSPSLLWARTELRGTVYILGEHDALTPARNTTIRIEQTGDSDVTNDSGSFRLFLPDQFKAGERVTLTVEAQGYQVLDPTAGETRIPAEPLKDHVTVRFGF